MTFGRSDPGAGNEAEQIMISVLRAAVAVVLFPVVAFAGPVERACNKSDRDAANRQVCACIGQVADNTLNGGDQRRAAKLFNDPDRAHATWISQTSNDDAFWDRYKAFGEQAEAYCAG
jgi:hypothetical protein